MCKIESFFSFRLEGKNLYFTEELIHNIFYIPVRLIAKNMG